MILDQKNKISNLVLRTPEKQAEVFFDPRRDVPKVVVDDLFRMISESGRFVTPGTLIVTAVFFKTFFPEKQSPLTSSARVIADRVNDFLSSNIENRDIDWLLELAEIVVAFPELRGRVVEKAAEIWKKGVSIYGGYVAQSAAAQLNTAAALRIMFPNKVFSLEMENHIRALTQEMISDIQLNHTLRSKFAEQDIE